MTVLKLGVGQTVAKGKQWCDLGSFVVPIADIQTFAVDDLEVLARPVVIRRSVMEPLGECTLES